MGGPSLSLLSSIMTYSAGVLPSWTPERNRMRMYWMMNSRAGMPTDHRAKAQLCRKPERTCCQSPAKPFVTTPAATKAQKAWNIASVARMAAITP